MEILYFIQVIQISLITLSLLINSNNDSKEMTGGGVGAFAKIGSKFKKGKPKAPDSSKLPESLNAEGKAGKKGLGSYLKSQGKKLAKAATDKGDRQMFQNKLAGLSGTQTSSERLTSASASVSMYRIIKFIVYFLSLLLLPLMPFYAATKSLFTKGIPLFKEVVIPESVDYDKKILEAELKKNKENQDKITK